MKTEKYVIEKGVPMPTARKGKRMKYPFDELRKDESFLVTDEGEQKSVVSCARAYSQRHGVELVARKTEEGVRVWRLDGTVRRQRKQKSEVEGVGSDHMNKKRGRPRKNTQEQDTVIA